MTPDPGFTDRMKDGAFRDGYDTGYGDGFAVARRDSNFIVAVGNVADGFTYYGPFTEEADAQLWIERNDSDSPAWVVPLSRPFVDLDSDYDDGFRETDAEGRPPDPDA